VTDATRDHWRSANDLEIKVKETTPLDFRILWIEDQTEEYDPLLDDLQGLVGQENLVVVRTEEEGRFQLRGHAFDLVLLDLMLPRDEGESKEGLIRIESGQRLLRELRQNTDWATSPDCKVVVWTARASPDALTEVNALLGPSGRLMRKPIPIEDIVRVTLEMLKGTG
jgi:CheY-like chemotaxis protein